MHSIAFCVRFFRSEADRPRSERALRTLLEALVAIDCDILRAYPHLPRLADAGVRYRPEAQETWCDILCILDRGHEDCDGLACWKAAELIVRDGHRARAELSLRKMADDWLMYHVQARDLDTGELHDPSRLFGMDRFRPVHPSRRRAA